MTKFHFTMLVQENIYWGWVFFKNTCLMITGSKQHREYLSRCTFMRIPINIHLKLKFWKGIRLDGRLCCWVVYYPTNFIPKTKRCPNLSLFTLQLFERILSLAQTFTECTRYCALSQFILISFHIPSTWEEREVPLR